ncbi:MAG: hypothetical protein QNI90_05580 [Dinoroseobacter sp.]|nr:hypothetical protein [Dinoroseobacter sp.]
MTTLTTNAEPHERVTRMLGYVLTLGTQDAWFGFRIVIRKRLTLEERVSLAFMALRALDPADAAKTAEAALGCDGGEVAS